MRRRANPGRWRLADKQASRNRWWDRPPTLPGSPNAPARCSTCPQQRPETRIGDLERDGLLLREADRGSSKKVDQVQQRVL
jgi:hypothetical protein